MKIERRDQACTVPGSEMWQPKKIFDEAQHRRKVVLGVIDRAWPSIG
jgi:hypothetical protein